MMFLNYRITCKSRNNKTLIQKRCQKRLFQLNCAFTLMTRSILEGNEVPGIDKQKPGKSGTLIVNSERSPESSFGSL